MKRRLLVILVVPFVMVALSQSAQAQAECDSDADCIDGFICESMGAMTCSVVCTPDGECSEDPDCEAEEFSACIPGPCTSDDDCSEGMRCLELEFVEGCAAEPMPDCPPPGEGECPDYDPMPSDEDCGEVITESFCLPEWIGPCDTAADCGDGFECVPDEMCTCSGGTDSDFAPCPDDEPDCADEREEWEDDCLCEPTDETYCRPAELECDEDAACPEGWTCEEMGSMDTPCWIEEDGTEHCDESPVEAPDGYCMPPYFDDWGWGGGSSSSDESGIDFEEALDAATGGGNARPTGHHAGGDDDGQGINGSSNGCQAVPGAGNASDALWLLPLLLGLGLRRK
jgi:hypothetical protein